MTSAQPNSAAVGDPKWGRPGMASETRQPRPRVEPDEHEGTDARGQQAGISTSSIMAPPSPVASISRKAPVRGEPSRVLMAAKLPAAATTVWVRAARPA